MVSSASIDTLRETLRGEQSQLELWVRESMAAMDSLHLELADWERDLKRRQAELEDREESLRKTAASRDGDVQSELRELRRLVERQGEVLERLAKAAV
jgi:hypothetical protein